MADILSDYSLSSPLIPRLPVRNRSNNTPTTPSKRANRLPVLPEISGEHDVSFSSPSTASSTSSTPCRSTCLKVKRLTRYGRNEFGAFALTDDFLSTAPRAAPQPPPSSLPSSSPSTKSMHRSVRLSSFDIVIDISASEPASPVSEIPAAPCTPPRRRDLRRLSPPRSRSPTPSLTSMSACSSTEMPLTPGASDDESPGLQLPSKKAAIPCPRISKHPLMIKSTASLSASDAHSEDTFEFTLGPFSPLPGLQAEQNEAADEQEEEDDDALWYSRELSQVLSLPSPRDSSNGRARPDSLLPMPRSASSGTDQPSAYGKPLPVIPRTSVPNPQLDPTFPQSMTLPPRLTLRASDRASEPPSPLTLPSPVAPAAPHQFESTSHRKSLTITVPRTLLPNKITVSDILDDINAWSLGTPSASTSSSTPVLSPPRVPHSPALSQSSEYDPVEFIISYAARPDSPEPAPSLPATTGTEMPATFLDLEDDDEEDKIRSRWSSSTLATLAPPTTSLPGSPTFAAASARLRLHLASVARRVRIRRAGWCNNNNGSGERTASIHSAEGTLHVRSSSEPDKRRFEF
ncbi:hypothetical protein F5888DRAFT_1221739 [Russula emetica]|nr:hypothetical protein F5888DRAFT_1221739 [Russula emetica]